MARAFMGDFPRLALAAFKSARIPTMVLNRGRARAHAYAEYSTRSPYLCAALTSGNDLPHCLSHALLLMLTGYALCISLAHCLPLSNCVGTRCDSNGCRYLGPVVL